MIASEDKINSVEQIINKSKNKPLNDKQKPKSKILKENQNSFN